MSKLLTLRDLRDLHSFLPKEAVIAGGAIRDMYFGKAPKDIDVWLPYDVQFGPDAVKHWEKWPNAGVISNYKQSSSREEYASRGKIHLIQDYEWNGFELQLITINGNEVYEYISGFDAGINMGYFDGYLVYPDEFVHDAVEKKYTLFEDTPTTRKRAERFCKELGLELDLSKARVDDTERGQPDREDGADFLAA